MFGGDTKDYLCCFTAVAPAAASLRLGLGSLLEHLLGCSRTAAAATVAPCVLGVSYDPLGRFGHLHVLLLFRPGSTRRTRRRFRSHHAFELGLDVSEPADLGPDLRAPSEAPNLLETSLGAAMVVAR